MHLVTIPPGARWEARLHELAETVVHVISGEGNMLFGEGLGEPLSVRPGKFLHIPADTPHLTFNASETTPCTAVIARADPSEQESVKRYEAGGPSDRRGQVPRDGSPVRGMPVGDAGTAAGRRRSHGAGPAR